jgi:LPXTG-site transpeptidase (sortase) family protein
MVRLWPSSLGRHVQVPSQVLGAVALAGVLGAALAVSWSDGTPNHDAVVDPRPHAAAFVPKPSVNFGWVAAAAIGGRVTVSFPPPPAPTAPPATILIESLDVHRPVEPVGVDRFGVMYQPKNLWNAGWYKGGPVPGAPGDAVIEGHAGYPKAPLLFANLNKLRSGDKIVVVLSDGSRQLFLVSSMSIWRAGTSPEDLGRPYGDPRLTLITCTGPFDDHYKTYADRLVVQASYAGLA